MPKRNYSTTVDAGCPHTRKLVFAVSELVVQRQNLTFMKDPGNSTAHDETHIPMEAFLMRTERELEFALDARETDELRMVDAALRRPRPPAASPARKRSSRPAILRGP